MTDLAGYQVIVSRLQPVQGGIPAAARQEIGVRAALGDFAVIEHEDLIGPCR